MKNFFLKCNHWNLFIILILLNIIDAITTTILVNKYGPGIEANPILRDTLYQYGIGGLFAIKFSAIVWLGIVVAIVVEFYNKRRAATVLNRCLLVLNIILAVVVVNNAILLYNIY